MRVRGRSVARHRQHDAAAAALIGQGLCYGSILLACAWPLLLIYGLGAIAWPIGVLMVCDKPPLTQLRVRHHRKWVLWPLAVTGACLVLLPITRLSLLSLGIATFVQVVCVGLSLVWLHLFVHKIVSAARLSALALSAKTLAILSGLITLFLVMAPLLSYMEFNIWPHDGGVLDFMLLTIFRYAVLEFFFWCALSWSINRIRKESLRLAQQRSLAA